MPVDHHPVEVPKATTDPVKPHLLQRGEWWCHVRPHTMQVGQQLGAFELDLSGLSTGPAKFTCFVTATIQGHDYANARICIRKESMDPSIEGESGWGKGTGGDHDTLTISDVFADLERARYTVWIGAVQGYFLQIRYVLRILLQAPTGAQEATSPDQ